MKIFLTLFVVALALPLAANPDTKQLSDTELAQKVSAQAEQILQLSQEVTWLEAQCVPPRGTSRQEVEKKFGAGHPVRERITSKIASPEVVPENSPRRAYEFATAETLFVTYDNEWKVLSAKYRDPHKSNNGPFIPDIMTPDFMRLRLEWQHGEIVGLRHRIEQMKRIVEEYKKRFHTTAISEADYIEQMRRQIADLEMQCVPTKGTARSEVEKRFGIGQPTFSGKVPPAAGIAENSPYRSYKFASTETLYVAYDQEWKVGRAFFTDRSSIKGRPAGVPVPMGEERQEVEMRLEQMKRIVNQYNTLINVPET